MIDKVVVLMLPLEATPGTGALIGRRNVQRPGLEMQGPKHRRAHSRFRGSRFSWKGLVRHRHAIGGLPEIGQVITLPRTGTTGTGKGGPVFETTVVGTSCATAVKLKRQIAARWEKFHEGEWLVNQR